MSSNDSNDGFEKEIKKIIEEKKKWENFFEILSRKYIFIPLIIVLVWVVDSPHINIVGLVLKLIRRIAGIH